MSIYPSIFNDVLSPITPGPSSSNTCAPFRIGHIMRQLLGIEPQYLSIKMATFGGFKDTFYSMQSDLAFIGGVLGKDRLLYNLDNAYKDAENCNLKLDFSFEDHIPTIPSELAEIFLSGKDASVTATAISLGGGNISISKVNGFDTDIDAKCYQLLLFGANCNCSEIIRRIKTRIEFDCKFTISESEEKWLISCKSTLNYTDEFIEYLHSIPEITSVRLLLPEFSIIPSQDPKVIFKSSEEMLTYAEITKKPLWQVAIDYEKGLSNISEEEILEKAGELYDISIESIEKGLSGGFSFDGVTRPFAKKYKEFYQRGQLIPVGIGDTGTFEALSIMEYSNAHGKIVCMPTGGSSGVIPAAIRSTAKALNLDRDAQIKALLVAGLIGVFFYNTNYSGSFGCQAEIGVAISMAAAALVSLKGGDAKVIEKAAVFGAQSVLGLVCNPVDGFVQVPCFLRNMTAVPTAVVCANSAIVGMDTLISLDDISTSLMEIGEKIRYSNRCIDCHTQ